MMRRELSPQQRPVYAALASNSGLCHLLVIQRSPFRLKSFYATRETIMRISLHPKGSTSVSVIIALSVLAALSASVLVIVATNQTTRTNLLQKTQSFYIGQAALEFAMQQILVGGNPNPIPTRYFLGQPFDISRTCGKI